MWHAACAPVSVQGSPPLEVPAVQDQSPPLLTSLNVDTIVTVSLHPRSPSGAQGGRDSGSSFSGDSAAPPGAFTLPMCCLCRIKTVSSPGGHPRPLCSLLCAPCFVQDLALSRCRGRRENQAGSPLPSVEEAAAQRVYEACLVQVATTEAFLLLPSAPPSPWLPSLVSEGPSVLRPSPGGHKEVTVRR